MLASEQGQNIEKLARAVISTDGSDENKIASAARADTTGREKADRDPDRAARPGRPNL